MPPYIGYLNHKQVFWSMQSPEHTESFICIMVIDSLPEGSICYPSFKFFAQGHIVVGLTIHWCHVPECLIIRTSIITFAVRIKIFIENAKNVKSSKENCGFIDQRKSSKATTNIIEETGVSSYNWIFWEGGKVQLFKWEGASRQYVNQMLLHLTALSLTTIQNSDLFHLTPNIKFQLGLHEQIISPIDH